MNISNKNDIETIFCNVDTILSISKTFLDLTQQRFEDWSPKSSIGDVFKEITPYFKLYLSY